MLSRQPSQQQLQQKIVASNALGTHQQNKINSVSQAQSFHVQPDIKLPLFNPLQPDSEESVAAINMAILEAGASQFKQFDMPEYLPKSINDLKQKKVKSMALQFRRQTGRDFGCKKQDSAFAPTEINQFLSTKKRLIAHSINQNTNQLIVSRHGCELMENIQQYNFRKEQCDQTQVNRSRSIKKSDQNENKDDDEQKTDLNDSSKFILSKSKKYFQNIYFDKQSNDNKSLFTASRKSVDDESEDIRCFIDDSNKQKLLLKNDSIVKNKLKFDHQTGRRTRQKQNLLAMLQQQSGVDRVYNTEYNSNITHAKRKKYMEYRKQLKQ